MFSKLLLKLLNLIGLKLVKEREKKIKKVMEINESLLKEEYDYKKLKELGEDETLKELIYIDKNGNKWYMLSNYLNMDMERFTNIQIAERYLSLNMTPETLIEIVVLMKKEFENSNWVNLGSLIAELLVRANFKAEKDIMVVYMALVFLINDETTKYDVDLYNKKLQIIKNDSELFSFFLQKLQSRFQIFADNSKKILNYLENSEMIKLKLNEVRKHQSS